MEKKQLPIRNVIALLLLVVIGFLSVRIWHLEREKREVNNDLVHLSEIRYGLFNVDEWKRIIVNIISKNIEEFDLNEQDREAMRKKVTKFLHSLIDEFEQRYHDQELHRTGGFLEQAKGVMRSAVVSGTKLFDHLREDIPVFTEEILDFVGDPENAEMLKEYLTEKLDEYASETFAETDYSEHDRIVAKYVAENRADAITRMKERLAAIDKAKQPYLMVWYPLVVVSLLLVLIFPLVGLVEHLSVVGISLTLLLLGLTLPMLEIDARIASLDFHLLGEQVAFTDQVVYHKCKSILEVVHLMLGQKDLQVVVVGLLVLLFSVVFPILKLLSCVAYLMFPQIRQNRVLQFFVYRTGKWSMADVLVVAIFMSYIGFSGILNEQLGQLQHIAVSINLLTTNNSTLLFGFYAFVSFVLMGLLLAFRLQRLED
ncbi:MAG: hypothetical protein GC178_06885 [Flavobacteriales bacterium]|nr:hypothetical protein [Flavobacteriales bacterium]